MIYPENNSTDIPIVPIFIIGTIPNANRYELQISTDQYFYFNIISNPYWQFEEPLTIDSLYFAPAIRYPQDFKNNSTYYWRVRALNTYTYETSDWSEVYEYTTVSSGISLEKSQIIYPENNSTIPWLNVEFQWNRVEYANWYQIQWSTSSIFSGFTYYMANENELTYNTNLKPVNYYYCKVIAINENSISQFSSVNNFETGNQVILTKDKLTFDDGSGNDNYDNNLDLYYLIKPDNAENIILTFLSFDTEKDYDFVTVYDGSNADSPIIGKFSGNTIPSSITSSQGSMLVRFTTDWLTTSKGWSAKYESSSWIPTYQEISDYIEQLSLKYKVPSVIIKAIVEQESGWRQFNDDGSPIFHNEKDAYGNIVKKGWGLMQVTVPVNVDKTKLYLATNVEEGHEQGENNFYIYYDLVEVNIDFLKHNWRYNLEIGTRLLVAKKIAPYPIGSGGAEDDARILENWYYPLAYYNGAVKYIGQSYYNGNDPKFHYPRKIINNDNWKDKSIFPYQECIYNIISQKYIIPENYRKFFGPPIIVTLPGPVEVFTGDGNYNYVHPDFCFYDWAVYYQDGTVKIGNGGGKNNGCIPDYKTFSGQIVHIVPFGEPGISVTQIVTSKGIYNFNSNGNKTAAAINFKSINGLGSCTVNFFAKEPDQIGFIGKAPKNISKYRWVINQVGLLSFVAEIMIDLSQLPDRIINPSTIKVYSRSSPGIGLFNELPSTYDATSNTLFTTVINFSEFILGSDEPLTYVTNNIYVPKNYFLYQNYPNPFNPSTKIKYSVPKTSFVNITVYDILGREIATLVNEEKSPGNYEVEFDGGNLSNGIYLYRMQSGEFSETKKLILLK